MITKRLLLTRGVIGAAAALGSWSWADLSRAAETFEVSHGDGEWRRLLTPMQYMILRQTGLSAPSAAHCCTRTAGVFSLVPARLRPVLLDTKFDSGTGWPSFWAPLDDAVGTVRDTDFGMVRTAVHCRRCGGHLGHVFDDGPRPTGLRYCMNGFAMTFKPMTT